MQSVFRKIIRPFLSLERYGRLPFHPELILVGGLLGCWILTGLFSCRQNAFPPDRTLVVVHTSALRAAPGPQADETGLLEPGTRLLDLGQVSDFLSAIMLEDTFRQAPWIKVQTASGRTGWIFGVSVRPLQAPARQWLNEKRFLACFGPSLSAAWKAWTSAPAPTTDAAFAQALRKGLQLQDTMNIILTRQLTRENSGPAAGMYWITENTPGFSIQQLPETGSYRLFFHYGHLARLAARTSGPQDDQYVQVLLQAFPKDSIESHLPVWVFPASVTSSYSNLGAGEHAKMLTTISAALQTCPLFRPELLRLKDMVLEDILNQNRAYWQAQDKILAELDRLQNARLSCLNARDLLALETRRKMFEAPAPNGLVLNVRAGEK